MKTKQVIDEYKIIVDYTNNGYYVMAKRERDTAWHILSEYKLINKRTGKTIVTATGMREPKNMFNREKPKIYKDLYYEVTRPIVCHQPWQANEELIRVMVRLNGSVDYYL